MLKQLTVLLGKADYQCRVSDGSHSWLIDEPAEKGGGDTAHDPIAALLASLGSCSAITLRMYAERKGWPVEEIAVCVQWEQYEVDGQKVSRFTRDVTVTGPIDEAQRQRLQQIVQSCPVSRILEGRSVIDTTIRNS
ncbi:MAG: OsmC family peroxiredoxin [Chitinophagaceae bacterium]|nr:MAG: OsmC family peroxiredoxin [Chitinophagaceae bacterium]